MIDQRHEAAARGSLGLADQAVGPKTHESLANRVATDSEATSSASLGEPLTPREASAEDRVTELAPLDLLARPLYGVGLKRHGRALDITPLVNVGRKKEGWAWLRTPNRTRPTGRMPS
jgi:hypothetical protein